MEIISFLEACTLIKGRINQTAAKYSALRRDRISLLIRAKLHW